MDVNCKYVEADVTNRDLGQYLLGAATLLVTPSMDAISVIMKVADVYHRR